MSPFLRERTRAKPGRTIDGNRPFFSGISPFITSSGRLDFLSGGNFGRVVILVAAKNCTHHLIQRFRDSPLKVVWSPGSALM